MNRNDTIEELLSVQALFESGHPDMTVLKFTDCVRAILDKADEAESIRCAKCLADAIHDAQIGTTAGDGGTAVVTYQGSTFCFTHFKEVLKPNPGPVLGQLPNRRGGFAHIHSGMTECGQAYWDGAGWAPCKRYVNHHSPCGYADNTAY